MNEYITKKINGEIITIGALILNQQQMPQVYHDYLHKYLTEELADRHNDILFFSDDSKQAQEFEECRKQLRNPYNVMLQHGSDFKPYLFN